MVEVINKLARVQRQMLQGSIAPQAEPDHPDRRTHGVT
jgi:hypothetical protein